MLDGARYFGRFIDPASSSHYIIHLFVFRMSGIVQIQVYMSLFCLRTEGIESLAFTSDLHTMKNLFMYLIYFKLNIFQRDTSTESDNSRTYKQI